MLRQGGIVLRSVNKKTRLIPINVFFVELIIVLMFFSISVAVVLKMFASADAKAMKNESGERAVLCVQSLSEMYSVSGDMRETAVKYFGEPYCNFADDGSCTVYLDKRAMPLVVFEADIKDPAENMVKLYLTETVTESGCGRLCDLYINVTDIINGREEQFYSQKSSAYIPDFKGGAANEA